MSGTYKITVAPNGARRQKSDHPALPITPAELAQTAVACFDEGAAQIHLHVRDSNGQHTLEAGRYREAIDAVKEAAPKLAIQITTEFGGKYSVAEQEACLKALAPAAASIAIREMARDQDIATRVYARANEAGTQVQHILYSPECIAQLLHWRKLGVVHSGQSDVIFVLGQYDPPLLATPEMLTPFVNAVAGLDWTVCAFGRFEHPCLLAAMKLGGNVRVGFENNLEMPDGKMFKNNQASVKELVRAGRVAGFEPIT